MALRRPSRRVAWFAAAMTMAVTAGAAGLAVSVPGASAAGTVRFSQPFHDNTVDGPELLFPAPPDGEVGVAYRDQLTDPGGTGPFIWTVSSGTLPAGISLSADGTLAGTPTAAGTFSFTVNVTDASGQSATEAASVTVIDRVATTFAAPSGEIDTAYTDTLTADGGTAPYTWSVKLGILPPGITLSSAGVLAGTPATAGNYPVTVNVTDHNGGIATRAITLVIAAGPELYFAAPPFGEIRSNYSDTLVASGGTGPYTWSVSSGSLPAGITLDPGTGTLAGTPTAAGTSIFTVEVTDADGQSATEATTLTIISGPALSFPAPPAGEIGTAYSDTLTASGGTGPYTWSVSSGSPPAGITLDPATGTLAGTPTAAGTSTFTFTVQVTDAHGQSATKATTLTIISGPALSFPAPPAGEIGTAYSDTLTPSGGTGPYTWSVSSGNLPAGITLDPATGTLAGTATAAGTFPFTVQVTDTDGQSATEATTLVVAPSVALATSAASVSFGKPVTFTATIAPAAVSGSVTFSDLLSTGPQSGQAVTLGTTALSGGTATLTVDLPAFNASTVTATYSGDPTYASAVSRPTGVQVTAYNGEVIIDQFRLSGPGGSGDQYAELYNAGPAVSLAGFTLAASSGTSVTVPSNAPVLAAGGTYLIAGAGYSLSAVAAPDLSAASLGTAGLRVIAPDGPGTVTDAAGSAGAQAGFYSGTPLPALSGTPADQYAWVRLEKAGAPVDSGGNAADFQLVSTTGGVVGRVQSCLGSPSPQATGSPVQANANLPSALLDPAQGATDAPNSVYVAGTPGLLTLRRTITNTSEATITTAEIRITSLSEVNGPPEPDVTAQPPSLAQLRVINPATPTTQITITGGHTVTVQNLSVDGPATTVPGGGLDTTLTIRLPGGSLAPGASVSIALSLAVDRPGAYWAGYDVDAVPAPAPASASAPASAPDGQGRTGQGRTGQPATPPSQLLHPATPSRYAFGHGTLP